MNRFINMKLSYIKKSAKRQKQKAIVLISRPDFQEDMLSLRKKWNIPADGIKTDEEKRKWELDLSRATTKYYDEEWPKFHEELEQLQIHGPYKKFKERQDEINDFAPGNAFEKDIKSILQKYLLSPKWKSPIRRYILLNDVDNMAMNVGVTIAGHLNDYEPVEYQLCLHIDEDTTLEDIKEIWSDVMEHQEMLIYKKQNKFQPIKNFERDKRIYELEQEGKTIKEIGDIINSEYDDGLLDGEIKQIIKRYKKRLNIN